MSRQAYLGKDSVVYREDATGYCVLTTMESPVPEGWIRKVAETVTDVERVWKKIDTQERESASRMTEALYNRRIEKLNGMRTHLLTRKVSADCTPFERDFITASLKVLDRKEQMLNSHSVYGIAKMQEQSEPLPPTPQPKVTTDA